jgi:hypothetical protein
MTSMRSRIRLPLGLAVVTGTAAVFLPFTSNVPPFGAVVPDSMIDVWRLAWPFFLIVPIAVLGVRVARSGRLTRADAIVAYALAIGVAGLTLSQYMTGPLKVDRTQEAISMVLPIVLLTGGGWLVWHFRRASGAGNLSPLAALAVPYVANMLLCLIAFWGDWQIGAYVSVAATAASVWVAILALRHVAV